MHEQRLGRVAGAGALGLGVEDDPQRVVEVGARVDVDVAVARRRVDDRHLGDLGQRLLQPLAAARDDQVDDALLGRQLGELLAAAGQQRDRAVGELGGDDRGEHGVGVRRRGRAAQHDRVAGLQRQRGGVDGHVRARLVDHGDDAERHADLAQVEPVGQPLAADDLADGVGQRGDRAHGVGDAGEPRGVEREPVHQRVGEAVLAPGVEVAGVGLEDLGRALLELRRRRAAAPRPWPRCSSWRARARRAGGQAGVGDGGGGDGHGKSLGQHEVVPVDCFLGRARQLLAHLGGLAADHAPQLDRRVVADPLAHEAVVGLADLDRVAGVEAAVDLDDADRQQRRAALAQRPRGAGVDAERPLRRLGVLQPQLEARVLALPGGEARADRLARPRARDRRRPRGPRRSRC